MAIITLPGHGLSLSAARRSKTWFKVLDSVDTAKSDGYAFVGEFVNHESTIEVPNDTWLLEYVEDVSASRLRGRVVTLYQVRGGELAEVERWELGPEKGWALKVRDQIHAMTTPTAAATPDVDALMAERERLLGRLAEIDALLPEPEGTEMSTSEAAVALGVSVRTVQRWAAAGKVTAVKDDGGRWVVTITL